MRGVNKVILIGTVGADPVVRKFDNGGMVAQMSVATSEEWKDKVTGEPRQITDWHRIVAQGNLASICERFIRKGSKIYIEGLMRTREYRDNQDQVRYVTEVRANQIQFLDPKPKDNNDSFARYMNPMGHTQDAAIEQKPAPTYQRKPEAQHHDQEVSAHAQGTQAYYQQVANQPPQSSRDQAYGAEHQPPMYQPRTTR